MPGLEIDGTRAHLHGIASFKRQHVSAECALRVMLGARAPYPVYTRHTRRVPCVVPGLLACALKPARRLATTLQHPHCVWGRGEGCPLV